MAITVIAKLKVKAGNEAQFEEAARAMIAKVGAAEPGTQSYILHKSVQSKATEQEPTTYVYYEVYQDQASFDAHGKTAHMAEFGGKLRGILDGRPAVDILSEVTRK